MINNYADYIKILKDLAPMDNETLYSMVKILDKIDDVPNTVNNGAVEGNTSTVVRRPPLPVDISLPTDINEKNGKPNSINLNLQQSDNNAFSESGIYANVSKIQSNNKSILFNVEYLGKSDVNIPGWFKTTPIIDKKAIVDLQTASVKEPLFNPGWSRSIISSVLSINVNKGSLNIEKIVDNVSRGIPLSTLPRHSIRALVPKALILIDKSIAMEPFLKDQEFVLNEIKNVVGVSRTRIFYFMDCPIRGIWSDSDDDYYDNDLHNNQYFYYKTPILLLSDLGIAQSHRIHEKSRVDEWIEFLNRMKMADNPIFAFVPYPEDRWPESLKGKIKIIQWDRGTSVHTIKRITRKSFKDGL